MFFKKKIFFEKSANAARNIEKRVFSTDQKTPIHDDQNIEIYGFVL